MDAFFHFGNFHKDETHTTDTHTKNVRAETAGDAYTESTENANAETAGEIHTQRTENMHAETTRNTPKTAKGCGKPTSKKYLIYVVAAAGIWFSFKYLLPLILPLVLAALVVIPSASVIHKINRRFHIGKGILTGGLLILIVFLLLLLIWMVIAWLVGNISVVLQKGNAIWGQITEIVCDGCKIIEEHTGMQRGAFMSMVKERGTVMLLDLQNSLIPKVMMESVKSLRWIINVVVTLLVTSLAAVLLAKDYEAIKRALYKMQDMSVVIGIFHKIGSMLVGYVKAQGVIYLAIAGINLLGAFLLKLQHPFQTALITAFLDALPFIGTGIILGPLAVWYLLNAEYWKALICAGIYLLCVVTRELLEPRLIGRNTGILPIFILISIYTGIKLYGLGGVILGPLSFLLYKEIVMTIQRYNP